MPREIFFTDELVRASPSERMGECIIYTTPFGLVKENKGGMLFLAHQNAWVPLENTHGQLLLVHGNSSAGLLPKTVYDSKWDYTKDKFKTYWWIFLLLLAVASTLSALNVPRFWMSGIFIASTSAILYREHEEAGVRRAVISLLLGLIAFVAIAFLVELTYSILHGLQVMMGLCDWMECSSPHTLLRSGSPYIEGGKGRYGL